MSHSRTRIMRLKLEMNRTGMAKPIRELLDTILDEQSALCWIDALAWLLDNASTGEWRRVAMVKMAEMKKKQESLNKTL